MYWLGPFEYPSKRALLDEMKHFLGTAPVGRVDDPEYVQKLGLLLDLHPDSARKIGVGVDHFLVARNQLSGQGLHLVRKDGTGDSFSYKKCVTGVAQSPYGKVCEALRFVVRPQLEAFRATLTFPVTCAISGVAIMKSNELHIDHRIPFWQLLDQFGELRGLDLKSLETTGNALHLALVDGGIADAFEVFHREHAQLQPSSRSANLLKGGTPPKD